uniref:RNase H type-1 domain-containing protein n=1 Tax=Panagrolaimus sp. ES5 TaxID=591445 RepID=A0AC34GU97_9BILA
MSGESSKESTSAGSKSMRPRATKIQSSNKLVRLIKSNSDIHNSDTAPEVASSRAVSEPATTTTRDENLAATTSETGPLMKVVVSPERGPVELLNSTDGATIVYTDASLIKNGTAGIGVYYGKGHELNASQRLPGKHKSVGWAEIIAATVALQRLRSWRKYNKGPVIIRTDHLMIVEAMQMPRISIMSHPKYHVELLTLKRIAREFPKGVQFEHVYAHNGEEGNEEADALATKATSSNNEPAPRRTRSKPPSPRMSRRTRSAYVKSAPPKVHGLGKHNKNAPKENDVSLVRLQATKPYIPPPETIALRDIKQMEMMDENTQEESSSVKQSRTGSVPSVKIIGLRNVRDETMKEEKTQSEDRSGSSRTPLSRTPVSKGSVKRKTKKSQVKIPSASRKKEKTDRQRKSVSKSLKKKNVRGKKTLDEEINKAVPKDNKSQEPENEASVRQRRRSQPLPDVDPSVREKSKKSRKSKSRNTLRKNQPKPNPP